MEQHGHDSLNEILQSLSTGVPINDAIASSVGSMQRLEVEFAEYARQRAADFGKELDFDRDDYPDPPTPEDVLSWAEGKENNYWAMMVHARSAMQRREYAEAVEILEALHSQGVATGERDGILERLAECYRALGNAEKERETIQEILKVSSDALSSMERFIEMEREQENWTSVKQVAQRALAVQPLSLRTQRSYVQACRNLDLLADSVDALVAMKAMDDVDTAGLDYQLAEAYLDSEDRDQARRYCVDALLRAPRYRDAYRLLAEIETPVVKTDKQSTDGDSADAPKTSDAPKAGDPPETTDAPKTVDPSETVE